MEVRKTTLLIISCVLILLLLSGVVVYLFSNEIQNSLGIQSSYSTAARDFRGEAISFTAGTKLVSIPPKLSEEVLSYMKQEMTENGPLPLKIERKGNPLPFGIP